MDDPEKRLAALREFEIMDTPPEAAFDDLTRLTSFICDTPIALVTLLDLKRQWFKSKVGISACETPIEHAFCAHAIRKEKVFIVPDAMLDTRFLSNPLVTGAPKIRFYAGAPLITSDGVALGTLCAIDTIPRELSGDQREALEALARGVISALEHRKTIAELRFALSENRKVEKEVEALQNLIPMCAWCHDVRDDASFWHSVEDYLASRPEMKITHGICPDCAAKLGELEEAVATYEV